MATKKDETKTETTPEVNPNEAKKLAMAARRSRQVIFAGKHFKGATPFKPNPKRGKSEARFALYKEGMTVQEYIEAGGYAADIKWDLDRDFIRIEEKPETTA